MSETLGERLSEDGRGMVVITIWLLDAGVGIGLYGQGHFLLALLALVLALPAIMLSLYLISAGQSLRRRVPSEHTPDRARLTRPFHGR